jgi:hypothetical protein
VARERDEVLAHAVSHLEVEIDLTAFENDAARFQHRLSEGLAKAVWTATQEGAGLAIQTHPYKDRTGTLTRSIRATMLEQGPGYAIGKIAALAPYASFVEEGTPPHDIEPKKADGYLAWENPESQGDWHFAKLVHHPGTKAMPFMGPAYLKAERVLEAQLGLAVENAAREVGMEP